jgi:hypothetical protein
MPVPSYRHQLFHTEPCRASLHKSPQRMLDAYAELSRLTEAMTPPTIRSIEFLGFSPLSHARPVWI